jgi:hypothetical protein
MNLTLSELSLAGCFEGIEGGQYQSGSWLFENQIYVFSALDLVQKVNILGGPIHLVHSKWKNLA